MTASFRHIPPLLLAILVGIASPPARCEDPTQSPAGDVDRAPLWYRWVKVPLERWEDWSPEGHGHFYLGMDADDFKKKIRDIKTAGRADGPTEAATVASASYEARLDGHELVDGRAVLDVAYSGSQATRMALAPCGLAIGQAVWADRGGEPAKMGLGGRKTLEVLVRQSGRLAFDWSLGGKLGGQGAVDFQLELPPSPAIHLALELPDGMTPVLERGIAVAETSSRNRFTRWRIELGGRHRTSLRVVPAEDAKQVARLPHLRQSLTYDFSTLGVRLYAGLRLDAVNEPIRQLTLVTDADLRLIKIVHGMQSVAWSEAPTPGDESTRRVIIEFPEPLQGTGRELLISAVAPLKLDRPWRLPGLRAEGVVWQQTEESVAILRVQRPLLVKKLVAIGGRQSKPLREEQFSRPSADYATAEPLKGETVEVQCFSPDSGVEVVISQPESPLQLDCGYTIELDGPETTARVAADFHLARGERFSLEADVTRQWIIDSVESDPRDALADWKVGSKTGSPRRLTLRLANPVAPDRPVRIVINARRLRWSAGRDHSVKELIPLQFDAYEGGRRLIWLRTVEPYQLGLRGDERVNWVNSQSLDAASSTLFAELPGEFLFENDARAANLAVKLETRKPDYSGRIRTDITVSDTSMVQSYRLECDPNVGRIDCVVVHFSEPMTGDLHWDHGTEDEVRPIIVPQQPDSQTDGALREGRAWEIRLNPPRSEPFSITAIRTTQLTELRPISMASLPEASSQEGRIIVYSSGSAAVRIENNGLKQIPCEAAPVGEYSSARATYSYDPARDASRETAPLCIAPHSAAAQPPSAWVWSCQVRSRFQADGLGRHLATYRLQSAGKEQLRIALPAGVEPEAVDGAWIDGTPVVFRETDGREIRRLVIDLPADRKFPVVAIHFTTNGPRLNHIRGISAPLPSVDVPTLSRQWTIWLPPGYGALLDDPQPQASWSSSLSWTERLFGPLGRPANQGPPDPFNPEDWARLLGRRPTREWAASKTVKLLENISGQIHHMERDRETDPLDWGTLLANASSQALSPGISNDHPEIVLLIDPEALANVEETPWTAAAASPRGPSAAGGIAMLNRANLLLLVHEKAILLTGADRAEIDAGQLEPFEDQMLWWVGPGRLADRIEAALAQVPGHRFIPVAQWADQPAPARSPWKTRQASGRQPVDTLGWTAYSVEVTDEAPVEVLVIRSHTLRSSRWIAFLALVSLAWWKLLYRPAVVIALAGMFALGAFLLPQLLAPMASGGLIAMLLVLGFRMTSSDFVGLDSGKHSAGESGSGSWSTAVIKVGILILAAGLILAISSSAWGQQASAPPARQVHEVYVPVDDNGEPAGERYWLSDVFYGELSRRANALAARPQDWLLGAATYRATLSWDSVPKRLVLSDLTAVFDLTLLDYQARVRIEPMVAAGTPLSLDGAKLDGATIYPIWQEEQEEGGAWVFDVVGEDRCRLELTFGTPDARTDDTPGGFELTIPPLANSRLELKLPPDAPEIEIPRAIGAVTRREDSSLLVAELGATDRLTVRWRDATRATVDELLWLKIGPSSVILDAQFKFRVGEGQLKDVLLTVDPRLVRQDPYQSDYVEIVEGDRIPGRSPSEPHSVPLEFDRAVSDSVTVKANLKLIGTLGVGNLLLPRLESRGAVVGKRWLAVSVAPALDRSKQGPEHVESVSVPEFMEAWGEAEVQLPDSAYSLSSGEPAWSIVTKLREPKTTADQTLAVTFSPEEARLDFEAALTTEGGDRYQYVLSTPPGLAIDRISVVQDHEEHVARWATAGNDKTTVFLGAAVTGRHKMTLEGRLRVVNRPQMPLPVIQVEGAESLSSRIHLLRRPQVRIHVSHPSGLEEVEIGPTDEAPNGPGRFVQCFQATGEEPVAARIALTPNIPTLNADQVTTLTHDGDSWNAKIDYRLVIGDGVVDELRLSMPPELNGPFEIDPAMAFEPPGEGNRELTIRPRSPLEGDYRFSILSPLEFNPGDRVRVPEVVLKNTRLRKHRLVLPTQFQTRPVEWETQDLRKTKLDDDLLPTLVARESFVAYRVTGPSFSAAIRPVGGDAEVYLADVSVAWRRNGGRHGVATFDLESANMLECPLNLPEGHRLVQVTVAGTQVMANPVAANRWLLPLGPNSLPQRIEVVFDGSVPQPKADGPMKFDAPALGNLPVRKTLWTISGPSDLKLQEQDPVTVEPVTPLKHGVHRLQNLIRLIEIAKNSTAEQSPGGGGWHQVYSRRQAAAFRDAQRHLASAGHTGEAKQDAEVLRSIEIEQALSDRSIGDGVIQAWLDTQCRPHWSTQHFLAQTSGSIALASSRTKDGTFSRRLALSAWLTGMTFLAMVGVWRGTWTSLFRQWPHPCGVAVGLAWWIWLRPEALGLLLVLLSLASCLRSGWRKTGQSASAIVSLTLNDP